MAIFLGGGALRRAFRSLYTVSSASSFVTAAQKFNRYANGIQLVQNLQIAINQYLAAPETILQGARLRTLLNGVARQFPLSHNAGANSFALVLRSGIPLLEQQMQNVVPVDTGFLRSQTSVFYGSVIPLGGNHYFTFIAIAPSKENYITVIFDTRYAIYVINNYHLQVFYSECAVIMRRAWAAYVRSFIRFLAVEVFR